MLEHSIYIRRSFRKLYSVEHQIFWSHDYGRYTHTSSIVPALQDENATIRVYWLENEQILTGHVRRIMVMPDIAGIEKHQEMGMNTEKQAADAGSGERYGEYRILDMIGRGGMGVVYRAEHIETGAHVALKTLTLPDAGMLQGIRREIHALAQVKHPGIVRIYDHGIRNGLPWYAMEFLKGMTLRTALKQIRGKNSIMHQSPPDDRTLTAIDPKRDAIKDPISHPMTINSSCSDVSSFYPPSNRNSDDTEREPIFSDEIMAGLGFVGDLCHALAFLHGQGIVHRDLKPDNILIRDNGRPVLLDFGLMFHSGLQSHREMLSIVTQVSGTLAYMSPEQIRGELVDSRSDLYSLGCILYEIVTGIKPIQGSTIKEYIDGHLNNQVVEPLTLNPMLPNSINWLIMKLLEKQPQRRIGYALDVSRHLSAAGIQVPPAPEWPQPSLYLFRPGFIGRKQELETLVQFVEKLNEGKGGLYFITGESGVGKTRLAMEVVRNAARRRLFVLTGSCEYSETLPMEAFRKPLETIADYCRERGQSEFERIIGYRGHVLAMYAPSLMVAPDGQSWPKPAELPPHEAKLRLFSYIGETLFNLSESTTCLLVIDDLQWADELSLECLDAIIRGGLLEKSRVFILCLARREELPELLEKLIVEYPENHLVVKRLEEEHVSKMIRDMLALPRSPKVFSSFLNRQSEGNPFFVAEYLRAAVQAGFLWRDDECLWHILDSGDMLEDGPLFEQLELPMTLRELVSRRLIGLTAPACHIAEIAAVLGKQFTLPLLARVLDLNEKELFSGLNELLRRQILVEDRDGILRFEHDKIREVAVQQIDQQKLVIHNRAAVKAIESLYEATIADYSADLARHCEQGGLLEKAFYYALTAAQRAETVFAYPNAIRLLKSAVTIATRLDDRQKEALSLEKLAEVLFFPGRMSEALSFAREACQIHEELGNKDAVANVTELQAKIAWAMGDLDDSIVLYTKAIKMYQLRQNRSLEGEAISALANVYGAKGLLGKARELCEKALPILRAEGNRNAEGMTLSRLGIIADLEGDKETSQTVFKQALALFRELKDKRNEALVMNNLALIENQDNRFDEALHLLNQALGILREVADRRYEAVVIQNIASTYQKLGLHQQSLQVHQQAVDINRRIGDKRAMGVALTGVADSLTEIGRIDEALTAYQQSTDLLAAVGDNFYLAESLIKLARLIRRTGGNPDNVQQCLDQAAACLDIIGFFYIRVFLLCEYGHLNLMRGKNASNFLDQAAELEGKITSYKSDCLVAIERLEQAHFMVRAGVKDKLLNGECRADIPPGIHHWLSTDQK